MPIPREHLQERLSDAYVRAVIANAGYQYVTPEGIEYGVDGYIQETQLINERQVHSTGFMIQVQVKSSLNWELGNSDVIYDLQVSAYNKLVNKEGPTPRILIVFAMPSDQSSWLSVSEEELLLRRCCYWLRLNGLPSSNTSTQRIFLPRGQVFTPEAVQNMFRLLRNGEW